MHLYYIEGTSKKESSYFTLKTKLRLFVKYNPHFGRKNVKINRTGANNVEFNEDCIDFYKKYNENEFKQIKIRLNDPFDPATNRSRDYSSTPIERPNRIPRFNYVENTFTRSESFDSSDNDNDDDNDYEGAYTPPPSREVTQQPRILASIPSLLFRSSLHSIINYEDDTYHISIRNNAVNGLATTVRSNESSEERSSEDTQQANEEGEEDDSMS
jgi:hypothetical protein